MEIVSYRDILKQAVEAKIATGRYSFRQLAKNAGFGSPNHIQQILSGKRHLSRESGLRLARALRLSEPQIMFLLDQITLEHSTNETDRSEARKRLNAAAFQLEAGAFDETTTALFEYWYSPLVWSIVPLSANCNINFEKLSDYFYGMVPGKMLERALYRLTKEAFLKQDSTGKLTWNTETLDVKKERVALGIKDYSRRTILIAKTILKKLPEKNQSTRSTTVTFEAAKFGELESMVKQFHQEVLAWANTHKNPDSAIQFSSISALFESKKS